MPFPLLNSVSLRVRMVVLILLATVPVMAVAILVPSWLAERNLRAAAESDLAHAARKVADNVDAWDKTVVLLLEQMAQIPEIISMDPARQRPVLKRIAAVYDRFYLVGATYPDGKNEARADEESPRFYHDRDWFIKALAGQPVARQAVLSRTTHAPGMIVSAPIRRDDEIVGVIHIGTSLLDLSQEVGALKIGKTGHVYVVDDRQMLVAHPQMPQSDRLSDFSSIPPVAEMFRRGTGGSYAFTDGAGVRWLSESARAANGWGVVSVQEEREVLAAANQVRMFAAVATVGAMLLVATLTWALATRITCPLAAITKAAVELSEGRWQDQRVADESRRDEIGTLAHAFNVMAGKLRTTYAAIEQRVAERTEALNRSNAELIEAREAADAANRSKDEFLANMSHELRTPMTTILGYADLMADPSLSPVKRESYLSVVRSSARHLLAIINEVLDLASIEAGVMTTQIADVNVAQVVEEIVSSLHPKAVEKGIALRLVYGVGVPAVIRSDALRLRQILFNLVGNALKFTERGSVTINITLQRKNQPVDGANGDSGGAAASTNGGEADAPCDEAPCLRFAITDTGIGMTCEQVGRLFQRFQQVDPSPSRRFGGTGLGLVISQRLARMLGGDIVCKSEPGKGSTFTVTVAAGRVTAGTPTVAGSDAAAVATTLMPTGDLRGLRVLLAEDVPMNQMLFTTILERLGATVTAVDNGRLAIEAFDSATAAGQPFDVVLMDMQMPEVDGYTATTQLRAKGVTTPIIALTAHARESDRKACLDAGCSGFASKPLEPAQLVAVIRQHLVSHPFIS